MKLSINKFLFYKENSWDRPYWVGRCN